MMMTMMMPTALAQAQTSIPPLADYMRILPELVLSIFGIVIMIVDPLLDPESSHQSLGTIGLVGTLVALASTFVTPSPFESAYSWTPKPP